MEASQIIALVSSVVGALGLLLSFVVFLTNRHRASSEDAMRNQLVNDKLDRRNDMAKETRDNTREMSRMLNDHGLVLAKHTEQIATLFKRVERVEEKLSQSDEARKAREEERKKREEEERKKRDE